MNNIHMPTEYDYPTIMVKYMEVSTYSTVYVAMLVIDSPEEGLEYETVFIYGSTQETAEQALRNSVPNLLKIANIQPLHEALQVLEEAALQSETLM